MSIVADIVSHSVSTALRSAQNDLEMKKKRLSRFGCM